MEYLKGAPDARMGKRSPAQGLDFDQLYFRLTAARTDSPTMRSTYGTERMAARKKWPKISCWMEITKKMTGNLCSVWERKSVQKNEIGIIEFRTKTHVRVFERS